MVEIRFPSSTMASAGLPVSRQKRVVFILLAALQKSAPENPPLPHFDKLSMSHIFCWTPGGA